MDECPDLASLQGQNIWVHMSSVVLLFCFALAKSAITDFVWDASLQHAVHAYVCSITIKLTINYLQKEGVVLV